MVKTLSDIAKYSKLLFAGVVLLIVAELYFNIRFAQVCKYVDYAKPLPHPIAFESFPFVVYNMYSGKIDDWQHYGYTRIEADGEHLPLSSLPVFSAEQISNPIDKYLMYEPSGFNEEQLRSLLYYSFDSVAMGDKIYKRVSNSRIENMHDKWGRWLTWYVSSLKHKEVHSIKIYNCLYSYNEKGRPVKTEENLVYQFP
ncbi:MAG TPA: hypothetical protein VG603_04045 [Chitinophagales bacterium]|nr:hypothetical protein [Chitinophagales bacterium]